MKKPEVGQIVFSLNINRAHEGKKQVLTPIEVKTVGRKYFTAGKPDYSPHMDTQYFISDGSENSGFMPDSHAYESPQAWEDDKEHKSLFCYVLDVFQGYQRSNLSLEDLRDIKKIIQKS